MTVTVSELLRSGAARLAERGIDPQDARPLLASALAVPRDRLVLIGQDAVSAKAQAAFAAALDQRLAHRPVAKILGARMFWGRMFRVTDDVLDPRADTETLIAEALSGPVPERLLDLGTGTGCIGLTLLAEWPETAGVLTDLSDKALAVARANAADLGLKDRVEILRSDWFGAVTGAFDLIVSNPPYISAAEMADLAPEVSQYDPHLALTPGGDGLAPYRDIVARAAGFLTTGGRLMVEIGWRQGSPVAQIFAEAGLRDIRVLPDLEGRDRVVAAVK